MLREYINQAGGKNPDRPQFPRMLEDASRKEFDLVLFWTLDRFSHEGMAKAFGHLERVASDGVHWCAYKEEYLRGIGPFAGAALATLACVVEFERSRLSERVKAGLDRARAQGGQLGRPRAGLRPPRVLALRNRGLSTREIAAQTGVSHTTIARIPAASSSRNTGQNSRRHRGEIKASSSPRSPGKIKSGQEGTVKLKNHRTVMDRDSSGRWLPGVSGHALGRPRGALAELCCRQVTKHGLVDPLCRAMLV